MGECIMNYTKEQVKKAIDDGIIVGNGHAIIAPEHYEPFDVSHLDGTHESYFSTGKTTIYDDDGIPLESVEGVNNLSFLYSLVLQLDLEYQSYFGRGTQARELVEVLTKWANSEEEEYVH